MNHIMESLCRGASRITLLAFVGVWLMFMSSVIGPPLPAWLSPVSFGFGITALGIAFSDFVMRVLQPRVDPSDAATRGVNHESMPAAIVYGFRTLFAIAVIFLVVTASRAETPPPAALKYLPTLAAQQHTYWPDMPMPPALGSQVEQETGPCPGRTCWNPRAELRTHREQGVGFGQITRAWSASGALRFDALAELRQAHRQELAELTWANPYDPMLQLRALVLKDRDTFKRMAFASTTRDRMAFTLAAYNGGIGGVMSDRRMCAATSGCDPSLWFGHVERTSLKAKTAIKGYGKSFFEINRAYPRDILGPRMKRYQVLADVSPISLVEKNGQGAT